MSNYQKVKSGSLILSEPFMADDNFKRSVVLLCEHNDDGSVGFILNKATNIEVEQLVPDLEGVKANAWYGGPVENDKLFYLHQFYDLDGAIEIVDGIFWGGDFEILCLKLKSNTYSDQDVKFFLGYSGWGALQLKAEMESNSWIVARGVFSTIWKKRHQHHWKKIMEELGGDYKTMSTFPEDPSLN